jgi:hypothetical protein
MLSIILYKINPTKIVHIITTKKSILSGPNPTFKIKSNAMNKPVIDNGPYNENRQLTDNNLPINTTNFAHQVQTKNINMFK